MLCPRRFILVESVQYFSFFFFYVLVFAEFILTLRTMTERLRSANQKQAERYANPVMI